MTGPARPDRAVLLELDVLLENVERLVAEGDRQRYDADERYRWVLHRTTLRQLRNRLAHVRLPDIDEDLVWRTSTLRPGQLRARVQQFRGL